MLYVLWVMLYVVCCMYYVVCIMGYVVCIMGYVLYIIYTGNVVNSLHILMASKFSVIGKNNRVNTASSRKRTV